MMAFIQVFLGKNSTGRTTLAIATAKQLASFGKRVLLIGQGWDPTLAMLLKTPITTNPEEIAPNLSVVAFQSSNLLTRNWEDLKKLEAQYLRTPILKSVYGQELGILPGMDEALALNALREYDASDRYDAIIYDGSGDQAMLRMFGIPEILAWYARRFRQLFAESDLGRTVLPFLQPLISSVATFDWSGDSFAQQTNQVNNLLEQGRQAISNPKRVLAYLVTTENEVEIATALALWGSSQQVGLTIGGVLLLNQTDATSPAAEQLAAFSPLPVYPIPTAAQADWQTLVSALPDPNAIPSVPAPMTVDLGTRQVRLFLPGFDKGQVKLTQNGPEITIDAGDQRRNILLPPELKSNPVKAARFQDQYLTISF